MQCGQIASSILKSRIVSGNVGYLSSHSFSEVGQDPRELSRSLFGIAIGGIPFFGGDIGGGTALKLFFGDCSPGALGAFGSAEDHAFQRDASAALHAVAGNRSGSFGGGAFPVVDMKLCGTGNCFPVEDFSSVGASSCKSAKGSYRVV